MAALLGTTTVVFRGIVLGRISFIASFSFLFQVRLQTMPKPKPGETPLYAGTLDCVKKTVKHEGVRGLYKGEH